MQRQSLSLAVKALSHDAKRECFWSYEKDLCWKARFICLITAAEKHPLCRNSALTPIKAVSLRYAALLVKPTTLVPRTTPVLVMDNALASRPLLGRLGCSM